MPSFSETTANLQNILRERQKDPYLVHECAQYPNLPYNYALANCAPLQLVAMYDYSSQAPCDSKKLVVVVAMSDPCWITSQLKVR